MAKNTKRLDSLLVDRGLAPSRERARALILAGKVRVNDRIVSKAGAPIGEDAQVALATPDHPYVGRGGIKLAHALETFAIITADRRALDIGASTGGFTDVLLQRHALTSSLDVGPATSIGACADPRVTVREGVNVPA